MCTNYRPPEEQYFDVMDIPRARGFTWPKETFQDRNAPIIRIGAGGKEAIVASYAMIPRRHVRTGQRPPSTVNARAETIGEKPSYAKYWRELQLCLVPMQYFYEPNYESGPAVRWGIGMADREPFAVAGIWRAWNEPDGTTAHSFTQITINADDHPLMKRFHKPGEEKRSLVIVPPEEYDDWLECSDPERARSFLQLYPAELMTAWAEPKPIKEKAPDPNGSLF